jgi:hypothetical protein
MLILVTLFLGMMGVYLSDPAVSPDQAACLTLKAHCAFGALL